MRYWELIAPLDENGDPLNEQASFGATNAACVAVNAQPFMSPNPTGDQGIYASKPKKKAKTKPKVAVIRR